MVTLPFTVKRKNRPSPDNMTLGEHLGELRRRVIICVIALLVGATIAVFAYEPILNFLLHPLCSVEASTRHHTSKGASSLLIASNGTCNLFVTSPLDGLTLRVKIALFGGLVLASPIILFQVWRFVTPGLKASERRYAVPFVLSAFVLFLLGAATAYITLPHALGWLKSVGGPNLQAIYDPIPYLGLILLMMTIFGLTFEFPVILVSLELARVVTPARLLKLVALGGHHHRGDRRRLHSELRSLLHVRPGRPAHRLLLPLHRHREAARALTAPHGPSRRRRGRRSSRPTCRSPSTTSNTRPFGPSTPDTRCSCPLRPGRARRWWRRTPCTGPWPRDGKAFYTTPLKALSNQKYAELVADLRRGACRAAHRGHDAAARGHRSSS